MAVKKAGNDMIDKTIKDDQVDSARSAIMQMIQNEEIKIGEKFPPERVMAAQLGVSRNTLREAMKALDNMGIVKTVQGSGRFLVEQEDTMSRVLSARQLVGKYSARELMETRRVIEVGLVRLAAARATREDKLKLQNCYNRMVALASKQDRPEGFHEQFYMQDYEFHYLIACISGNSILREMMNTMQGMIHEVSDWISILDAACENAVHWHGLLLAALMDNDAEKAEQLMEQHLLSIETMLLSAQKKKHL
jgi:GntR family transcriptional repressor for pyruvate dehydrogenase complex